MRQKHCSNSCLVSVANFECLNTLLNSRRHKISKYTWNPFHLFQNSLSRFHSPKILRIRHIDRSLCSLRVTNLNISVSPITNSPHISYQPEKLPSSVKFIFRCPSYRLRETRVELRYQILVPKIEFSMFAEYRMCVDRTRKPNCL